MANTPQKMRYTTSELGLIKNTFAENEPLLKLMRKVFLQMELTEEEVGLIKKSFNKNLIKLARKTYLPELDADAPMNQLIDLWLTVELKDKPVDEGILNIKIRVALISLIEKGLSRLQNPDKDGIPSIANIEIPKEVTEDFYISLYARNMLVSHCELQMHQLTVLAGQKDETVEETRKRLLQNSTK